MHGYIILNIAGFFFKIQKTELAFIHSKLYRAPPVCQMIFNGLELQWGQESWSACPTKACIPVKETSNETSDQAPAGRAEAHSSMQRSQGIFPRKGWQDSAGR